MLFRVVFFIIVNVFSVLPLNLNEEWKLYKERFKIILSEIENIEAIRYFISNKRFIEEHNKRNAGFKLKINKFAHLSDHQFITRYLTQIDVNETSSSEHFNMDMNVEMNKAITDTVIDWRKKGAVTSVKNQENCGSCWAFSAAGALESRYFIKNGVLLNISAQELIDCSKKYDTHGCHGGSERKGFMYVQDNGITTEEFYPYMNEERKCNANNKPRKLRISSYKTIPYGSDYMLTLNLLNGPVSVSLDSSSKEFRFYKSGIFDSSKCSRFRLNHEALAVGFGKDGNNEYYIVKNSWGEIWGNKGYILISKQKMNSCGITSRAVYPVIK